MKPLIKWAGGKSSELKHITELIPSFENYFEPFFGGGALFFLLEPKKAYVNDISPDLVSFYKLLKEKNGKRKKFKEELYSYVKNWERINDYIEHFGNSFLQIYGNYKQDKITETEFETEIKKLFEKKIVPFNGLFSEKFSINRDGLRISIQKNVISRLKRVKTKIDSSNNFSDKELVKNIETAFRSGFYLHFRRIMNMEKDLLISKEKKIANYYFVREFCYGGMFRFNAKGEFNVPYGGNAYNKKNFKSKVENLFSEKVGSLMDRAKIGNMDFEEFLSKHKPTKKDFVFFDPPYDTEFSEYEENPFEKQDQERLARVIKSLNSKFILIIKETPFIRNLYENTNKISIVSFDKTYLFNIKDRHNREVKHLIIHNIT